MRATHSIRHRTPEDQYRPTVTGSISATLVLLGLFLTAAYPIVALGIVASTGLAVASVLVLRRLRRNRRRRITAATTDRRVKA